jgi:type II secretory pathway component GspD/PulD (secretin)
LVIQSTDGVALQILEEILQREAPRVKDYEVFHLEHAPALWVRLNLRDYFEEDDGDKESNNDWFWPPAPKEKERSQLGKRQELRFIDDLDTNTIVVRGATPSELDTIRRLIELYDVPEPIDEAKTRHTRFFYIKYHDAPAIAATVKGAFADLLSSEDRAAQYPGREQQNGQGQGSDQPPPRPIGRSSSKLSIGVDTVSNVVIVNTEGEELMKVVEALIDKLDEAAMPATKVDVVRLGDGVTTGVVEKALRGILLQQQQQGQPGQQQRGQVPGQVPGSGQNPQAPFQIPQGLSFDNIETVE